MKIIYLACIAALTSPLLAHADTLSLSIGGGSWNESPSGNFQKTNDPTAVDVEDDFFWGEESQGYFFITLEHPVPLLPNIRFIQTTTDHSGSGVTSFTFDGKPFNGGGFVVNDVSIETTDLIAYYEILDNVVSLDLGLNIRNLKIDYNISSLLSSTSDSVSETIPMLYVLIGASPWPGLTISGELSYITFEGNTISDLTTKFAYTTDFLVGFEAGYRKQSFELDDASDTNADLNFDGIFAGAYVKF